MRIGLIGAGRLGSTLARYWVRAGHELLLSARRREPVEELIEELGPLAVSGTPAEAAAFGEVVVLAVPLGAVAALAEELAEPVSDRVVLDATNPFPKRDGAAAERALRSPLGSFGHTAACFPQARVVKGFNTVFVATLRSRLQATDPPLALPLAGHPDGCPVVERLVRDAGLVPVVVGGPERAVLLDPGGPLWNRALDERALRAELGGG
ncbi:MAG: NAD(P)-binding domain-containing protein [Alphaproteobacteria bacterium]|nr:NAD(P)-binding domain-containing protein [Alphaproteobacteria bacterium]